MEAQRAPAAKVQLGRGDVRGVLGPWGHPLYTSMTGLGFGIALACFSRIGLLVSLAYLARMQSNLFTLFGLGISIRDLVLILGGIGYLYGGLLGAIVFKLMQDWLAAMTPQYWQFWIGLILIVVGIVGDIRHSRVARSGARVWAELGRARMASSAVAMVGSSGRTSSAEMRGGMARTTRSNRSAPPSERICHSPPAGSSARTRTPTRTSTPTSAAAA